MNVINRLVVASLPAVPKPIVRHIAGRYIAGEHLSDAVRVVRRLNGHGMRATLDVLGEDITEEHEACSSRDNSIEVLRTIIREGLDANLSVKLTSLGLKLNTSFCEENVTAILRVAAQNNILVRLDMEDSSCTTDTIDIYQHLHKTFTNVGIVLQAYLRRTQEDIRGLIGDQARVRLCKGIYREPEEIALQGYEEINENFISSLRTLLSHRMHVGIATHDIRLVNAACAMIHEMQLTPEDYEFQMLLGVRHDLRDRLVREGHPLRVYVPYGTHWYRYSIRRFQENPKIAGYVFKSLFARSH